MTIATTNVADLAHVMEQMPYGMYIVGSRDAEGVPNGMMADWVMQVSFQPRLIAVAFENDAHTLGAIRANRRFTVNLLPEGEAGRKLAARFAQPFDDGKVLGRRHDGHRPFHPKLEGVAYTAAEGGAPILDEALSWMECEAIEFVGLGDHTLVAAKVLAGEVLQEADPLTSTYTGWNYSG